MPKTLISAQLKRGATYFLVYAPIIALVFWISYEIRFISEIGELSKEKAVNIFLYQQRPAALLWIIPLKFILLGFFKQYRGVFYYFRLYDAILLTLSLTLASLVLFLIPTLHNLIYTTNPSGTNIFIIPRSVVLIDFNLSVLAFLGVRVAIRTIRERIKKISGKFNEKSKKVAIIGAGSTGEQILSDLILKRGHNIEPLCFLDDNVSKHGLEIHGIPVAGRPEQLPELKNRLGISEVILTIPTKLVKRIREINSIAQSCGIKVLTIPPISDLSSGRVRVTDLRPVSVEDLLGRPPANLDGEAIAKLIKGRTVLVTGAGGSIGGEIARQVARQQPQQLIILDQCEVLLYTIEQELIEHGFGYLISPVIADVTDAARLDEIFKKYKPAVVLHAAAHKHVPMMESQPGEALKNNTLGTCLLADLASQYQAAEFVFISTDKAVNPTNIMGASKRLAEMVVQSMQHKPANQTKFIAVRFGNVLGSSGSVIPLFKKQIAAGGPVTVTHPDVTRYFMTIPEAVGLVLQSACQGNGGDILVLEMGKPLKIIEVARQLIELTGLRPDIDIEIKITGLRPGEKMFEELHHHGEEYSTTTHPRIFRFTGPKIDYEKLDPVLTQIRKLITEKGDDCKKGVQTIIPEYKPQI